MPGSAIRFGGPERWEAYGAMRPGIGLAACLSNRRRVYSDVNLSALYVQRDALSRDRRQMRNCSTS